MRKNKGFSLIEVLVTAVILAIVVGGAVVAHLSIRQLSRETVYHYTALNLAKEVLEFGEAGSFGHQLGMKYCYSLQSYPCNTITIPPTLNCGSEGSNGSSGYGLKEWKCWGGATPDPFSYLGDIEDKGLVPKGAPHSVVIYWWAEEDPNFYNAYQQTVEIIWQEEQTGLIKQEVLSVIPIRSVNDQLRLTTAEFWWD